MEAAQAEKNVFGVEAKLHPVTLMPLESGRGALPDEMQADIQCGEIERSHGKKAADDMRRKLADSRTIKAAQADMKAIKP
jgi:hypothetical protein